MRNIVMPSEDNAEARHGALAILIALMPIAAALVGILFIAPTERSMGHAQRIVYVHVAVAWLGLLGMLATAATGLLYLLCRNLAWDYWSQAAAELGWLCCGLTLITGSLWARHAWGTWWTWDPRLTSAFVLWVIYSGYLLMRANVDDPHRRARVAAVLAIVGTLDIPFVVMTTRWFRGIHPVSPEMDPSMRMVLGLSLIGFTWFFTCVAAQRRRQLRLEGQLTCIEQEILE
jgi:heme exporter protein C